MGYPDPHTTGWNSLTPVTAILGEKAGPQRPFGSPSMAADARHETREPEQAPLDLIDEASMESFPCSDPPCYTRSHA